MLKLAVKLEPGGGQGLREWKNREGWPCGGFEYEYEIWMCINEKGKYIPLLYKKEKAF